MRLLKLKTALVAVDLEDPSPVVLRAAARLAGVADAKLHLLHIGDWPTVDGEARLRALFRDAAPGAADPEKAMVIPGSVAEVIVEQAARSDADVILIGPHRPGRDASGQLGSTAASVVRAARCPCLVTTTEVRLPLEHVIAAIDLTPAGRGVLSVALSWASALRPREREPRLTALHVAGESGREVEKRLREAVEATRALAGRAAQVAIRELIHEAAEPAEEILRLASEATDLLVIGAREAEEAGAAELGSVSAAVARATPCPLLLVPPAVWTAE